MRPDYGTVDHLRTAIALGDSVESPQQGFEHAHYDQGTIPLEHAVRLARFIRQKPQLRACPRHSYGAFGTGPVIARMSMATSSFRRRQGADQSHAHHRDLQTAGKTPFRQTSGI